MFSHDFLISNGFKAFFNIYEKKINDIRVMVTGDAVFLFMGIYMRKLNIKSEENLLKLINFFSIA